MVLEIGMSILLLTILVISWSGRELFYLIVHTIYLSSHSVVFHWYSWYWWCPLKVSKRKVMSIWLIAFALHFIRDVIFCWDIFIFASLSILAISILVRCMPLVLGSGASLMVVEDIGKYCSGKMYNFKIHGSVSIHKVDIVNPIKNL